jgi:hypothetical protein
VQEAHCHFFTLNNASFSSSPAFSANNSSISLIYINNKILFFLGKAKLLLFNFSKPCFFHSQKGKDYATKS